MLLRLVWGALTGHRSRTLLATLGVAVSAAMLLDMVMLASGMRVSFRSLLLSRGFQIRLAPKGTLPFDTDATIGDASDIARLLQRDRDIETVSPVLGGQLHVSLPMRSLSVIALGVIPAAQADFEVVAGHTPRDASDIVVTKEFLQASGATLGDTVLAAAGYDPQLRAMTGARRLIVVGQAHFLYLPTGQRAAAMLLPTLQAMDGPRFHDRVSLFMLKARDGVDVEHLRVSLERQFPSVSAISIQTAVQQVDQRLTYFRQLAFILGAISLIVGFLLVTTLVTVSVHERLGEIVIMRAIGVARIHIVVQIVLEGAVIMAVGSLAGLILGLVTARYLNSILASFPGLPAAIDFFLFQPRDAWSALGLLAGVGVLAGIYPSWRGASLPIAATLREEEAV